MSSAETPADPISVLMEAAVATHELFESFIDAGFNEWQALHMVTELLKVMAAGQHG